MMLMVSMRVITEGRCRHGEMSSPLERRLYEPGLISAHISDGMLFRYRCVHPGVKRFAWGFSFGVIFFGQNVIINSDNKTIYCKK